MNVYAGAKVKTPRPFFQAMNENISLIQKVAEIENVLNQLETAKANMVQKQKEDAVELATLRKACQMQKTDISELESTITDLKAEGEGERTSADVRLKAKIKECEADMKSMAEDYEGKLKNMEEIFMDERTKIKAELHEVQPYYLRCNVQQTNIPVVHFVNLRSQVMK